MDQESQMLIESIWRRDSIYGWICFIHICDDEKTGKSANLGILVREWEVCCIGLGDYLIFISSSVVGMNIIMAFLLFEMSCFEYNGLFVLPENSLKELLS